MACVRLGLIGTEDLRDVVAPSGLVTAEAVGIALMAQAKPDALPYVPRRTAPPLPCGGARWGSQQAHAPDGTCVLAGPADTATAPAAATWACS